MILRLSPDLSNQLKQLYADMQSDYDDVAALIGLTCTGCPDNCCDSYFLHHTYIEWAYLWQGLSFLPEDRRRDLTAKANAYELEARKLIAAGERLVVFASGKMAPSVGLEPSSVEPSAGALVSSSPHPPSRTAPASTRLMAEKNSILALPRQRG